MSKTTRSAWRKHQTRQAHEKQREDAVGRQAARDKLHLPTRGEVLAIAQAGGVGQTSAIGGVTRSQSNFSPRAA
jgi:hypothetical protein